MNDDEEEDLAQFLAQTPSDSELSFDEWVETHSNLNLKILVPICSSRAEKSGLEQVFFTRTVVLIFEGQRTRTRIKVAKTISWGAVLKSGTCFLYPQEGDEDCGDKGDLSIEIKIMKLSRA